MSPRNRGDAFSTAVAVKLFLDDNYKYSRKETHSGVPDPTADFLFGNRIGYCVHFAHAAVLLWRSLGLPARVGTGYAVEESARQGGSTIMVRASDAHAWPELYLEGAGWVVIDVTPRETLDETPPPVDEDLQRLLGEMARQMPPDPTKTEPQPPVKPREWLEPIGLFLIATAIALLAMLYLAKLWRRAAPLVGAAGVAAARGVPRVARSAGGGGLRARSRGEPGGVRGARAREAADLRAAHGDAPGRAAGPAARRRRSRGGRSGRVR
jgi:hypothetical protein